MPILGTETSVDILGHVMTVPQPDTLGDSLSGLEAARGRRKALSEEVIDDWSTLEYGQQVSLWRRKNFLAWGTVDEIAPDGSAVWFFVPKEFRRILVHATDGLAVRFAGS